jgi:ABC-2 type transport system permease protein
MRALEHSLVLTHRELLHWRREPWAPLFSVLFSLMLLLMFAYLFGGAVSLGVGGSVDYLDYLVPGILALTMLFGVETTMTSVALDSRRGVTDRLRSLPIDAVTVPVARASADLVSSAVQLAVLLAASLALGWRTAAGPADLLVAVLLLLWLRLAVLWVGIWLGLTFRSEQAVASIQVLVWPVAFLSGIFVPTTTMPGWLEAAATWNPVSATAAATRELVGVSELGAAGVLHEHALLAAAVWPAAILVVFVPLATRTFRNLAR